MMIAPRKVARTFLSIRADGRTAMSGLHLPGGTDISVHTGRRPDSNVRSTFPMPRTDLRPLLHFVAEVDIEEHVGHRGISDERGSRQTRQDT